MIVRQGLNIAAHLAAGAAFGALAFVALSAMKGCRRGEEVRNGNAEQSPVQGSGQSA